MKHRGVIVSIDPGIRGTGLAFWDMKEWGHALLPIAVEVITPPENQKWVMACSTLYEEFTDVLESYGVSKAYCEFPQYFMSPTGHAATADGNIFKLSSLIGVFMGCLLSRGGILIPIKVNKWKGQLPKGVVERRIRKLSPEIDTLGVESHAWDAVGIGLYAQGLFGENNVKHTTSPTNLESL